MLRYADLVDLQLCMLDAKLGQSERKPIIQAVDVADLQVIRNLETNRVHRDLCDPQRIWRRRFFPPELNQNVGRKWRLQDRQPESQVDLRLFVFAREGEVHWFIIVLSQCERHYP